MDIIYITKILIIDLVLLWMINKILKIDFDDLLEINVFGLIFRLLFLFLFFFGFCIFIRFFNLFRKVNIVDLNVYFAKFNSYNYSVLLFAFVLFVVMIRAFVSLFKLIFLQTHYYLMNVKKFKYYDEYISFIYFLVTWPNRLILYMLMKDYEWLQKNRTITYYGLKYLFTAVMALVFFIEIVFNNWCLQIFMILLPWYSLYKLIYTMNSFLIYNMEYLYDVIITEVLYSEDYLLITRLYTNHLYRIKNPDYKIEEDDFLILREYLNKLKK